MKALAEYSGGSRVGSSFWFAHCVSWPLAHLHICDDRLILTETEGAYDVPKQSIARLSIYRGWLSSKALRIEHSVATYPRFILFTSWHPDDLFESLTAGGYSIST